MKRTTRAMVLSVATAVVAALLLTGVAPAASQNGTSTQSMQQDLERSLPAGQSPHFYWQVLEAMGYEVDDIDYRKNERLIFDVNRDGRFYEVLLDLEGRPTRVWEVAVTPLHDNGGEGYQDDNRGEYRDGYRDDYRDDDRAGIVAAGTRIPVTLDRYLSSETSEAGDRFTLTVTETIDADMPRGTVFEGEVIAVEEAERPRRSGKLVLEATAVRLRYDTVGIEAAITAEGEEADEGVLDEIGDLRNIGIGAAVGAVLGGLIKGTKGALVGLIIGGAGTFLATEGENVELPAGTPLIVELSRDLEVR